MPPEKGSHKKKARVPGAPVVYETVMQTRGPIRTVTVKNEEIDLLVVIHPDDRATVTLR